MAVQRARVRDARRPPRVTLRAAEQDFFLRLARVLVGRYRLVLFFERRADWFEISAGHPYGPATSVHVRLDRDGQAFSLSGSPIHHCDVAVALRTRLRARLGLETR